MSFACTPHDEQRHRDRRKAREREREAPTTLTTTQGSSTNTQSVTVTETITIAIAWQRYILYVMHVCAYWWKWRKKWLPSTSDSLYISCTENNTKHLLGTLSFFSFFFHLARRNNGRMWMSFFGSAATRRTHTKCINAPDLMIENRTFGVGGRCAHTSNESISNWKAIDKPYSMSIVRVASRFNSTSAILRLHQLQYQSEQMDKYNFADISIS